MKKRQVQGPNWERNARKVPSVGAQCLFIVCAAFALSATGCQVLTYSGPNGERFSRSSLGAKTSLSSLTVEAGTNGIRRVELRGYTNDSTQALGVVTEAAVRAALQK